MRIAWLINNNSKEFFYGRGDSQKALAYTWSLRRLSSNFALFRSSKSPLRKDSTPILASLSSLRDLRASCIFNETESDTRVIR
jgi:hypothetical protein